MALLQVPALPLHPQRFIPWRWESQLADFYGGVAAGNPIENNDGWMGLAQDGAHSKSSKEQFFDECAD